MCFFVTECLTWRLRENKRYLCVAAVGIPDANSVKVTRNIKGFHFIIIIIIIIIIITTTISFMQVVYTYIPEENHVPKEYTGAAILSLLFMAPI
jgi:hypothetical protein